MGFGNFYKGEKKKKKKGEGKGGFTASPVFTPPTVTPKGKTKY
jgi:hypothetical protein